MQGLQALDINYIAIWPVVILSIAGMAILLFGASKKPPYGDIAFIAVAGCLLAGFATGRLWMLQLPMKAFSGMLVIDQFSLFFYFIFLIVGALAALTSISFVKGERLPPGEYYSLLLFSVIGMMLMTSAGDLVMIFLGLEISSIATYVLAGYRRSDIKSNESAIKYFVLGSFATAFLLYGMALIYGATGTTNLEQIKNAVSGNLNAATNQPLPIELLFIGAALMLIGFGFKIATAPFHFWTPDVYDGAPTPVTAFMAAGPKAAGFAAFLRVFVLTFSIGYSTDLHVVWASSLESIAILTMIVGNIAAISQTNLKRMLAYSSIAHAGYALVGFLADDWTSVAFYMLTYSVMNMGSFAIVELFSGRDGKTDLDSYAGFGFKNLGISIAMLVFMLSLAGVPLTGGFMGKFMLFRAAWDKGLHTLVIVAVLNSAVSVYYYLRPMVVMFFRESNDSSISIPAIPKSLIAVIVISLIGTLYLGILPGKIMELLENSRQLITLVN